MDDLSHAPGDLTGLVDAAHLRSRRYQMTPRERRGSILRNNRAD